MLGPPKRIQLVKTALFKVRSPVIVSQRRKLVVIELGQTICDPDESVEKAVSDQGDERSGLFGAGGTGIL